jgi:hypothetical protein
MNYQEPSILPSLTVHGNMEFSLKVGKIFSSRMENNCPLSCRNGSFTNFWKCLYSSII